MFLIYSQIGFDVFFLISIYKRAFAFEIGLRLFNSFDGSNLTFNIGRI